MWATNWILLKMGIRYTIIIWIINGVPKQISKMLLIGLRCCVTLPGYIHSCVYISLNKSTANRYRYVAKIIIGTPYIIGFCIHLNNVNS